MKVLSVVGARPQFIKAFPVSRALGRGHEEVLVHTGQHYDHDLSEVFFEELDLPKPAYNLEVGSDTHARQTGAILGELDDVIREESPDTVVVYGDTNSTLAAALVAAKTDPTLAHVEAGLRSHNWTMPEEVNRVLTDHCADYLFTPTPRAGARLDTESVHGEVHCVGDVAYDALQMVRDAALDRSGVLERLEVREGDYVLATIHRPRNTDDPDRLTSILDGLATASLPIVLPAHPRTFDALERAGLRERAADVLHLVEPVGYLDFLRLIDGADRVVTDSGGVQKEAFYLDTRCITLREETEWIETVECGWNSLVGADPDAISRELARPFSGTSKPSLYGEGVAAEAVVEVLERE